MLTSHPALESTHSNRKAVECKLNWYQSGSMMKAELSVLIKSLASSQVESLESLWAEKLSSKKHSLCLKPE